MANSRVDAQVGVGLAVGSKAVSSTQQANRADARAKKEASDQQLERLKATKRTSEDLANEADIQTLEIQNLKAQNQQQLRAANTQRTYQGMTRYDETGEIRFLNQMLTDIGKSSPMYKDINRLDNITEADRALVEQSGKVSMDLLTDPESPANKSFAKATMADGSQKIVNIDTWKGGTEYKKYASTEELERQKVSKEVLMLDSIGYDTSPRSREAFRRAMNEVGEGTDPKSPEFQEAYTKYYKETGSEDNMLRRRGSSRAENLTEKEAEADRRARGEGFTKGTPEYDKAFSGHMSEINTEYSRPSAIRKQEEADVVRDQLGEMDILNKPYTEMNLAERSKVEPLISKLESFSDSKMTTADKATLQRINELTHLGSVASEMTDAQTGLIDRVVRSVSKYVSNNTEGVQQEAAYAGYRNVVRNALFGSVLTPGETKAFTEQFGSLGQQRGPILAQLKSSLEQVRSQYETLVQTNDPYIIAYRTGKTANELQDVMDALDERIDMVGTAMSGRTITNSAVSRPSQASTATKATDTVLTDEDRAGLSAIRGK